MPIQNTSQTFRKIFLIRFVKSIVDHSKTDYVLALERLKRENLKQKIQGREELKKKMNLGLPKSITPIKNAGQNATRIKMPFQNIKPFQLTQRLSPVPSAIREIQPIPTTGNVDLGKLNPFIRDPTILEIECPGPGKNIFVKRIREKNKIPVILTEQEIEEIIEKFSQAAKIPISEGTLKVAVGSLIFSAVISGVVEPRFNISKMIYRM